MASAHLCTLHSYFKYLLHNRCISALDSRYKQKYPPVWACVATFSTSMYRDRVGVPHRRHTVRSQQLMMRKSTLSLLSRQRSWMLCKQRRVHLSVPCLQLLRYSSGNSDNGLEHTDSDRYVEYHVEETERESEIDNEIGLLGYNGNRLLEGNTDCLTGFETEWFSESEAIKTMLCCSDEEMIKLILRYPRLKNVELLKKVKANMKILLAKGVAEQKALSLLLSSKGTFLQVSPEELNTLFPEGRIRKGWYHDLSSRMESSLKCFKDIDNIKFLSILLHVKHELIMKLTPVYVLKRINTKSRAVLLKEKVDFLLSEGLSPNDIAYNLEILTISMKFLGRSIDEMKATVGQVSIKVLKSKYRIKLNQRYRSALSKASIILDCSISTFSRQQREFLNNINQVDAINVLEYLLDTGIDQVEIVKNPYVLGHKQEDVRDCLKKHVSACDIGTLDGQRKLLNLIVYSLDYGDSSV